MLAVFGWFPGKTSFFVKPVRPIVCPGLITGYNALSWIVMGAQVQWGIPTGLIYQWPHKGLNQQPTSVWTGFQDVPATSIATLELKYLTQKALALPEILCQNEITTTDQCIIHRGVPGSTQSLPKFTRYSQTSEVETHIYTSVHVYVYIYTYSCIL